MALTLEMLKARLDDMDERALETNVGIAILLDTIIRLLEANGALTRQDLATELRTIEASLGEQWNRAPWHVAAGLLHHLERPQPKPPTRRSKR